MIPIILLAAGASSRMRGRDKLCEQIDGVALLRRQAVMARGVSDQVLVALPPHPHPRYDLITDLDVTPVEVAQAATGMGVSIATGFAALPAGAARAMLLLADLPEITKDDLHHMIAAMQSHPDALIWRGMTEDGKAGHPIIFDQSLFSGLSELQSDNGGQSVVAAAGNRVHLVPLTGQKARCDLDTPEDWAAWRARRG
jgi:CTP:molybdopterin cytidylyltransferase MocA